MYLYLKFLFLLTVLAVASYTLMNSVEKSLRIRESLQLKAENSKRVYNDTRVKNYRVNILDYRIPNL